MKDRPSPSVDRVLVGAFAALVVARPLVDAADPGRLRLTTSTGPLSFNLLLFVLLGFVAVRRAIFGGPRLGWSALVPLLLLGVAAVSIIGTSIDERYARPGLFIAWEWAALAAAFVLARVLTPSAEDARGIRNVLVASAVSIAGLGIYQAVAEFTGLPGTDPPATTSPQYLAGDEEAESEADRRTGLARQVHGTLDSPDAFVASCAVGFVLAWALLAGRADARRSLTVWSAAVVFIPALVFGILAMYRMPTDPFEAWSPTARALADRPALGTGAGNWTRVMGFAPDPRPSWCEIAGTIGLAGLGLVVFAFVLQLWFCRRQSADADVPVVQPGPRWEFHLGGVTGLVLGFVWAAGAIPAEAPNDEIFRLTTSALGRAALWIAAFTVLESARSPLRAREVVIAFAVLVLFGFVSSGPGRFTILFPLVVLFGLTADRRAGGELTRRFAPGAIALALVAGGMALGHLVTACVPGWATGSAVRQARMASRHYPDLERQIEQAAEGGPRTTARTKARNFLIGNILNPLVEASRRDPTNSALWREIAVWKRALWKVQLYLDGQAAARTAADAIHASDRVAELEPKSLDALWNRFYSLLLFRRMSDRRPDERLDELQQAVSDLVVRSPDSELFLRREVADMLLARREFVLAGKEIIKIIQLRAANEGGHLSDEQYYDLIDRGLRAIPAPPDELKAARKK